MVSEHDCLIHAYVKLNLKAVLIVSMTFFNRRLSRYHSWVMTGRRFSHSLAVGRDSARIGSAGVPDIAMLMVEGLSKLVTRLLMSSSMGLYEAMFLTAGFQL